MLPLRSSRTQNSIVLALGFLFFALFILFTTDRLRLLSPCVEVVFMNPGKGNKFCQSETCDNILKSGAKTCDICSHVQLSKRQRTGNSTASDAGGLTSGLVVPLSPVRVLPRAVAVTQGQASSSRQQQPSVARSSVASFAPQAPAPASRGPPDTSDSQDVGWGWDDQASHYDNAPEAEDFIGFCRISQSSKIRAIVRSERGLQSYAVCGYSTNESDGTLRFQVANFKTIS